MPGVKLVRSRSDVQFAEQLRVDLATRQWSVELASFSLGSAQELDPHTARSMVVIVPSAAEEFAFCMAWIKGALSHGWAPVLISPDVVALPEYAVSGASSIIYGGSIPYDQLFEELYRSLLGPLPPWLDMRTRPSLVQSPTGVAWWADDLFVADDKNDHVVRISPNDSTVVLPGLFEPHHVCVDRRKLVVANKSADEVLTCDIVDNMAQNVETIHSVGDTLLGRPHGAVIYSHASVIADTDNNRVVYRVAQNPWSDLSPKLGFSRPCGVCIDETGIWVADTFNHRVVKFNFQGQEVLEFGRFGEGDDEFSYPVAVQRWKNLLFVSDEQSERLKVYEVIEISDGVTILTTVDNNFAADWISQPFGISINRNNRMAVADRKQKCIWIVDLSSVTLPNRIQLPVS